MTVVSHSAERAKDIMQLHAIPATGSVEDGNFLLQGLQGLLQDGLSEQIATVYVIEIGRALREGTMLDHYRQHRQQAWGHTSLADFAQEFAAVYKNT